MITTLKAARVEDTRETILLESLNVSMLQFRAGQLQNSGRPHNSLRTRQRVARVYTYMEKMITELTRRRSLFANSKLRYSCATSLKVVGSIPVGVIGIFIDIILPVALWS